MNIGFSYGDGSSNFSASNLTNKWIRDWNGTTGDYSDANTGTVNYTGEVYYAANFFTDEGTVTKSGAETDSTPTTTPNGTVPLALVDNVTS
jgi:hypothetical protein